MPTVKLKTLKIKIHPTQNQKKLLDEFIDTSRFVYNRTLEHIKKGHKINFQDLRDLLVTENTKKGLDEYKAFDNTIKQYHKQKKKAKDKEIIEAQIKAFHKERRDFMKEYDYTKNPLIHDFETATPKDIRACAVKRCCDAFKTGFTNLKKGNIKHFNMKYKKKTEPIQSIELTPKIISIKDGNIRIAPEFFKDECILRIHQNNKNHIKDFIIDHNVDIVRFKKEYYIHLSIPTDSIENHNNLEKIAGVDLGIRTFATVHTNDKEITVVTEYKHRSDLFKKYNMKLKLLKSLKRIRKKNFNKLEKRKKNLVDCLHWDFINHLLKNNDVIYLGDIKSHDIVKGGKNRTLNLCFNDLKFYVLKQRLIYKAYVNGKRVYMVPEQYTTKTCSCCGKINNNVGSKEVFECEECKLITGRDINASKNMKMKGMFL